MKTMAQVTEESVLGALIYAPDRLWEIPPGTRERLLAGNGVLSQDHAAILDALVNAYGADQELRGMDLVDAIVAAVDDPSVREERLLGMAFHYTEPIFLARDADQLIEFAESRSGGPTTEWTSMYAAVVGPNDQDETTRVQEFVLSAVIRNPELAREVGEWLPVEAFTTLNRRDIYQAVLAADQLADIPAGGFGLRLVDEVRAARESYAATGTADLGLNNYDPSADASYISHLAHSSIEPFNGVEFSRVMLEQLTMTERYTSLPAPIRALWPSIYPEPYVPDIRYEGPPHIQPERALDVASMHAAHQRALATDERPITLDPPF